MGYKDMYVILCCTKVKHVNKSHQFRAVGGSLLPYVHYCMVVTMHQYLFLWPRWPQVLTTEAMANSSFQAMSPPGLDPVSRAVCPPTKRARCISEQRHR